MKTRRRHAIAVVGALAVLTVSACTADDGKEADPQSEGTHQAGSVKPGTLLTKAPLNAKASLPSAARDWLITYESENAAGQPIVVSGSVAIPEGEAPDGGWPILSWGHGTTFSADQVRFVKLIVDELTRNGVMEPARLFESPYTDHAPTGPEFFFLDADVDVIVETLNGIKRTAVPEEVA